ncbi:MAG TPA: hypothetical protein DDW65_06130 [Firmicutes bacterium]|nr:hypothetical protein [Bacillota bacterium]
MTRVKCTVDTCEFWKKDQLCGAEEIWVRNDIVGDPDDVANHFINATMVEFGKELGSHGKVKPSLGQEVAQTSPQTCCDTMRPIHER